MDQVFWIAAIAGAAFLMIAALFGSVGHAFTDGGSGHAHTGSVSDGHAGLVGHSDGAAAHGHAPVHTGHGPGFDLADLGDGLMAVLNPTFLAMGIAFFGLTGLLYRAFSLPETLSVCLAIPTGLLGAFYGTRSVGLLLSKGGESGHVRMRDLIGGLGEVTTAIPDKGFGEVTLNLGGSRISYPAKATSGIQRGERVFVERVDEGVVLVSRFQG